MRAGEQRASDGHALTFATRQVLHAPVKQRGDAKVGDQLLRLRRADPGTGASGAVLKVVSHG